MNPSAYAKLYLREIARFGRHCGPDEIRRAMNCRKDSIWCSAETMSLTLESLVAHGEAVRSHGQYAASEALRTDPRHGWELAEDPP